MNNTTINAKPPPYPYPLIMKSSFFLLTDKCFFDNIYLTVLLYDGGAFDVWAFVL